MKTDLLMDGEVAIQPEGFEQPFVYRGFRMVDEEKLREPARRRAAQDEPERHAAADLRPPLLAERRCATSSPGRCSRARRPAQVPQPAAGDGLEPLLGRGRELAAEQGLAELDRERFDQASRRGRSRRRARAGSRRDSSGGRSRSAARGRRAPGWAWRSITWPPANGSLSAGLEAAALRRSRPLRG